MTWPRKIADVPPRNEEAESASSDVLQGTGHDLARTRDLPWVPCLVAIGLGLRLYHYLRGTSIWGDEAVVIINVMDKSFSQPLGPSVMAGRRRPYSCG